MYVYLQGDMYSTLPQYTVFCVYNPDSKHQYIAPF